MFSCPIAICHIRQYQSNESEWNNFILKILRMQCVNMAMTYFPDAQLLQFKLEVFLLSKELFLPQYRSLWFFTIHFLKQ